MARALVYVRQSLRTDAETVLDAAAGTLTLPFLRLFLEHTHTLAKCPLTKDSKRSIPCMEFYLAMHQWRCFLGPMGVDQHSALSFT